MVKIAVASSDGYTVNQHFGRADKFFIYTADEETGEIVDENERIETSFCQDGAHNVDLMAKTLDELGDCQYLLVSRIGQRARNEVERRGMEVYEIPGDIAVSLEKLIQYIRLQNFLNETFKGVS